MRLRVLPPLMATCLAITGLATGALGADGNAASGGWRIEQGVSEPSYAVADATRTNLNIETVVLACESGAITGKGKGLLQLQLYLSDEGALQPTYRHDAALKDDPKAVVAIDGKEFPVSLLFADDHVVLTDDQDGPWPQLSPKLVAALQAGKSLTVKVDLLADTAGAPAMDGEAVFALGGSDAVAALQPCASGANPNVAEAHARH